MRHKRHVEQLRAEAIAKILILSSNPEMLIEETRSDIADFVIKLPNSHARVAVEVKMTCNLAQEKKRLLAEITSRFPPQEERLPVLLVVVEGNEVDGRLALLANWTVDGTLEIAKDAKLLPYSVELLQQYFGEVASRYEALRKLAS